MPPPAPKDAVDKALQLIDNILKDLESGKRDAQANAAAAAPQAARTAAEAGAANAPAEQATTPQSSKKEKKKKGKAEGCGAAAGRSTAQQPVELPAVQQVDLRVRWIAAWHFGLPVFAAWPLLLANNAASTYLAPALIARKWVLHAGRTSHIALQTVSTAHCLYR